MQRYIALVTPDVANKYLRVAPGDFRFPEFPGDVPNEALIPWPQQFNSCEHAGTVLAKFGISPTTILPFNLPMRVIKFHVVYRDQDGIVQTSQGYDTERLAEHASDEIAKYGTVLLIKPIQLDL